MEETTGRSKKSPRCGREAGHLAKAERRTGKRQARAADFARFLGAVRDEQAEFSLRRDADEAEHFLPVVGVQPGKGLIE